MAALPSLRQLSYLVTLSETLHFTEAARRSFVTQSTLSGGIMELERLLGGVLVERDRQNVRLTALGQQVVERSRELLAGANDLMRMSREMSEPFTGDLHLGIIPTIAPFILVPLLASINQKLPKVELYVHEEQSQVLIDRLEQGELDIVLLALPFDTRNLKVKEICKESLLLAYHPEDKISAKAEDMQALDMSRLILLKEGHCLRDHVLKSCPINEQSNHRVEVSSLPTLIQMIESNLGFSLLPLSSKQLLQQSTNSLVLLKHIEHQPERTLALITRKSTPLSGEFDLIVDLLNELSSELIPN